VLLAHYPNGAGRPSPPRPAFAGAVLAILGDDVSVPDAPTLAAVASAWVATPKRSLGLTLAAGMTGYLMAELIF